MVSMSSACLLHLVPLHQTSQWDFRIWAILGSGPNTKQSHKPSVDLATDDCDTSLRSRQGRSFKSRVSAAGLLSARSLQSQGATNRLTDLWKRLREKETERGGVASWGYSLTNCKSKRMQQAGASDHNKYMWGSCTDESQSWRCREHQGSVWATSERRAECDEKRHIIDSNDNFVPNL